MQFVMRDIVDVLKPVKATKKKLFLSLSFIHDVLLIFTLKIDIMKYMNVLMRA